jgi:hypothetical protein
MLRQGNGWRVPSWLVLELVRLSSYCLKLCHLDHTALTHWMSRSTQCGAALLCRGGDLLRGTGAADRSMATPTPGRSVSGAWLPLKHRFFRRPAR